MSYHNSIAETYSSIGGYPPDFFNQLASQAIIRVSAEIYKKFNASYRFPYEMVREHVEHLRWKSSSYVDWNVTMDDVVIYFVNQYAHALAESQGAYTSSPDSLYRRDSLITMSSPIKKKRPIHGVNFRMSAIG